MTARLHIIVVLALVLSLIGFAGFSPTQAANHAQTGAEPTSATPAGNLLPGQSISLDNPPVDQALGAQWRTLSDGQTHWYSFQHRGDNLPVHIWMDVEPNEGAGFRVFRAEDAQEIRGGRNPNDFTAIGRGNPNPVEPGYLFWRGVLPNSGTYYVMIEHGWQGNVSYSIYAAGPGLARAATPAAVQAPAQPAGQGDPQDTTQAAGQQTDQDAEQDDAAQPADNAAAQPADQGQAGAQPTGQATPQPTEQAAGADAAATPGVRWIPGESVSLDDPPVERALNAQWRTLSDGQTHWYSFQHRGDNLPVHIWMDVEPNEGAGFRVFRAEDARQIQGGRNANDFSAIGRGTPNPVEPGYLFWRGVLPNSGTYYVMIEHGWQGDVEYSIYAAGSGLARAATPAAAQAADQTTAAPVAQTAVQATAQPTAQATAQPTAAQATAQPTAQATAQPTVQTTDAAATTSGVRTLPGESVSLEDPPVDEALGAQWRNLTEGQTHWYSFQHRGDNLPVHIWMDVEPNEGAGFRVFRAEDAQEIRSGRNANDFTAIGRGNPNPVEPGYLFWRGVLPNSGTYYVMIEHGWEGVVSYSIYAAGSGLAR